ncbi:hypothetical protein [Pendulispora albinea]|uniref:Uncharacterized protein n=1 Tax=Pendulispora albinea TaxID=2741071 RepID=A0ABZ2LRF5_9BACT
MTTKTKSRKRNPKAIINVAAVIVELLARTDFQARDMLREPGHPPNVHVDTVSPRHVSARRGEKA